MKTCPVLRLLLSTILLVSISISAFAKKGGNPYPGGGGGGEEPDPNPEIGFTSSGRGKYPFDLVVANRDGSNQTILYSGYSPINDIEFSPIDDSLLFSENLSGETALRRLRYTYSANDGVQVDGLIETVESRPGLGLSDIDPTGIWVVFVADNKIWLKSLTDTNVGAGVVFDEIAIGRPARNAVWMDTGDLAIAYRDLGANENRVEIVSIDSIDKLGSFWSVSSTPLSQSPTLHAGEKLQTPIESSRFRNAILFSVRIDNGNTYKRKGVEYVIYEYQVSEWDIADNAVYALGISGIRPCFGANDEYLLAQEPDSGTGSNNNIWKISLLGDETTEIVAWGKGQDGKP